MSINTKLALLLTVTVGAVMLAASFQSLRAREAALESALSDELRAHAVTLQIALEENYRNGRREDAHRLMDRLRENSRVYGVILFGENSEILSSSRIEAPIEFRQPPELARVLQTGETVQFVRQMGDGKFLSIILPLEVSAGSPKRGAVEIVKPLALIEDDIADARMRWLLTTLLLLAAIFLVVYVVLRRNLSRPISALLSGARALGSGDLSYRVPVRTSGDELAQLGAEFNRMADSIETQREAIRTEAENRLNLEKELRHSERLASVGRLAAGIAHELGAPLNVIDARAEQLLENGEASREKQVKNLTTIRGQAMRITRIVRQLLNLARPYDLKFETVDLKRLLESASEGFSSDTKLKFEIRAAGSFTVPADADFLHQVFANIFQNAAHAMPFGGTVTVTLSEIDREGRKFVATNITDTGGGIAEENLERVFDPFYTTKDIGGGTGLGLAVARRIVEEHGGWIEAANSQDGGASFTVFLPIIEAE